MWADVVLEIERLYLLRLLFWAATSTVAGTALLVLTMALGRGSMMIRRFAVVCALLGGVELIAGVIEYRRLGLRDLAAATRLERFAWLQLGLYVGLVAVGATICALGRMVSFRAAASRDVALGVMGSGIAVALHGLALVTLELLLLAALSR
jgi:hypothetical protein